ncbi:MAG TPA: hypothetical protein VFL60_10740 [Gaiellaceae bacterium]|nr:hypothetical protein [Gaiellaceae bacterium]
MQRVWIAVASVWAMLLLVAVLAWSYAPAGPLPQAQPHTIVVRGANGKQQLVVVQPPAGQTHASTHTSGAAG